MRPGVLKPGKATMAAPQRQPPGPVGTFCWVSALPQAPNLAVQSAFCKVARGVGFGELLRVLISLQSNLAIALEGKPNAGSLVLPATRRAWHFLLHRGPQYRAVYLLHPNGIWESRNGAIAILKISNQPKECKWGRRPRGGR